MVFRFKDPQSDNTYEISDRMKDFMDRYYSGFLIQYLFRLLHLADKGRHSGYIVKEKIGGHPGVLSAYDVVAILKKASTGEEGVKGFLRVRGKFMQDAGVPLDDLVEFENELGIHPAPIEDRGFQAAFGGKDGAKFASAEVYWDLIKQEIRKGKRPYPVVR